MTPHDFNHKLLLAKDTALDTLEDLCAPAFPRRKATPEAKPDGTPLTWDEKQAFRRAQPPPLSPDEQHLAIAERTQRMRAASTILKTRPIGQDGNPLPISRHHPEHHTRTTPRHAATATTPDPTNPERERAGNDHQPQSAAEQAHHATSEAPDPTNPEGGRQRAGSDPDLTNPERQRAGNDHRPTNPPVPPSAAALSRSRCSAAPDAEQPDPDPEGRHERAGSDHHPPSTTHHPHHTTNQAPRPQPPPAGEAAG